MKGKADKLFANRSLSALVAVCMLLSMFSGILFLTNPNQTKAQAIGDLIVTSATYPGGYTIQNMEQPVDGNVLVSAGGILTIRDGTLSVISNYDPMQRHFVNIGAGGTVILEHGTITTYLDQIDPWPFLTFVVQNGGILTASGNSVLMFPGDMLIDNGAEVSLYDTEIVGLPDSIVDQFVVGTSGLISVDSANDGPEISVTDASLSLFDSAILDIPEYPSDMLVASNLTVDGASTLLAVNSYIGVDFGPASDLIDWYTHNTMVLSGTSVAHLYGCSLAEYMGDSADRAAAIVASGESYVALPLTKGPQDNTGQTLSALEKSNEGMTYHVGPGKRMAIDSFGAGAPAVLSGATLLVKYQVDSGYDGANFITYSTDEVTPLSTNIRPLATETYAVEKSFDLYDAGVTTIAALNTLDVDFIHSGTSGDVQVDSMSILISIGAEAYIYRWLNVTVGDEYGVPIPDARISSVFTGSSTFGGQPSFYFGTDGVQPLPPDSVLQYMGKNASTFSVTGADGIAVVPYLTDLVSGDQAPNSLFIGSFDITGTATIDTVVYSSSESFSFVAYPAMSKLDQYFDVTVEVAGISAPSPDPSRWLVVPLSPVQLELVIEDITYYHAGDVIVAANGTLIIDNAEFVVVQAFNNQRTIYIDSPAAYPARLLIENSKMTSDLAVDIIVKGYATLEVLDSVMEGVNIVATDHSNVILRNVAMDGTITTSWDSEASVRIYDTDLVVSPVLSGYTRGEFTNTSVPSVVVQDNAVALIYRWIHVTVLDGAGRPLPYADVTARFYVNNTFAGTAVSSASPTELGVAKVNALATNLTATGSRFVGNYRVNASYTFGGHTYNGTHNISVGVLPYTEPLGKNATYATMTIPDALPDLTVHQTPVPIVTDPTNPKKNSVTKVYATVHNDGVVGAYNVRVDFYDVNNLTMPVLDEEHMAVTFATVTIPWIGPGSSAVALANWTAGTPLAPDTHNLTIVVDRFNVIPEIDDTMAIGWGLVTVKNLPDVRVSSGASEIYASTSYVENGTVVTINARIHNDGDANAVGVTVQFWDGGILMDEDIVDFISAGSSETASITWVFTTTVPHTIRVIANPGLVFEELSYTNNEGSQQIKVYDHPDLTIYDVLVYPYGNNTHVATVPGGSVINVTAKIRNTHELPVSDPVVRMYINDSGGVPLIAPLDRPVTGTTTSMWPSVLVVVITVNLPTVDMTEPYEIKLIVNPTRSLVESSYDNNEIIGSLTIRDVRPDFSVTSADIHMFNLQNSPIQNEVYGHSVKIVVTVTNLGLTGANGVAIAMGIMNVSTSEVNTFNIANNKIDIGPAGQTTSVVNFTYVYVVKKTIPGVYQFWVDVDPEGQVADESDRTNNFAMTNFTINKLVCKVNLFTAVKEYKAGGLVVVTANVMYNNSEESVKNLPDGTVVFWLASASLPHTRWPGSQSLATNTSDAGIATATIQIPTDIATGSYVIEAVILTSSYYDATTSSPQQIHISAAGGAGLFPLWVWILIIVAVVGVVAGFTVYTYVYGLGKLVECGECGAFIPAASKRCPKCGVEFEPGTMKCSECGAWIPAESTECPNCGVKFIGEAEEEGDYLDRMKTEYEEMRSQFRELAKDELGKKFSDKQFEVWWKGQPSYISFEDWLAKEEEKKKERPAPCPVCGTLNPKEATVCHKCGTVFGAREGAAGRRGPPPTAEAAEEEAVVTEERSGTQAQMQQPVGQPRMVIRRPIEKRVVPKKIIRTPVSGEGAEGDQNQENQ